MARGVLWVRLPLPFALDHINVWLLADGDGWTLVDTGIADDATRAAWERLPPAVLGGRPLRRIVCTHFHPDRVGLAGWLSARHPGAELWAKPGGVPPRARPLRRRGARERGEGGRAPVLPPRRRPPTPPRRRRSSSRLPSYRRLRRATCRDYHRLRDGDELLAAGVALARRLGRRPLARARVPPRPARSAVLVSGDQVLPGITPNVSVRTGRARRGPGRRLPPVARPRCGASRGDVLVLPSHGRPVGGSPGASTSSPSTTEQRLEEVTRRLRRERPHRPRGDAGDVPAGPRRPTTSPWARRSPT